MFILGVHIIQAKPVTPLTAKTLATNYYKQHSSKVPQTLTLSYTETSPTGEALYYVYNVNTNDGFVIVTADDAAHPIIGYSTEGQFAVPEKNSPFNYWMTNRKNEIMSIKASNLVATDDIVKEWAGDFSAAGNLTKSAQRNNASNSLNSTSSYTVGSYLVQSLWNQNPYYNKICPGTGSNQAVTGCVATAMAQIMKFWAYPAKGIGSHSYCDCTASPYNMTVNNGTLTVNFGTTTYVWGSMPLTGITNTNVSQIATLMYDCGVSVDMNYSPSGSGAQVLAVDANYEGACAQNAYVTYFGYNSSTIKGYERTANTNPNSGYTDAQWLNLIETDINAGRPVEYAGQDPTNGGHTWVCDGYDASNNLHMNWGWGGASNGFFSINNLATSGYNPNTYHQILVGIQPPPAIDAGIATVVKPTGILCTSTFTPVVTIKNFGANTLTVSTVNYQVDGGSVLTYTWTGSLGTNLSTNINLPAITTTIGSHTLTAYTSSPNHGTDANATNDQSSTTFAYNTIGAALPLMEGFEGNASLPANWSTSQASNDVPWQVVTTVAHTGSNCIGFNDCDGDAGTDMTGFKEWLYTPTYDFSLASSASISFDVGYVPAYDSATPKLYTDSLAVHYSIDCGTTWHRIYYKGGATLATAPSFTIRTTTNCVAPTSSQWRTETTNLSSILGQNNVMFAFENISDWGNWIYIDNINITAVNTTGIASLGKTGVIVYPNPAHSNLFINADENTTTISVTDIIGQTVVGEQKVTPQQTNSIDISNLSNGVYLVKVNSSDNQVKVIRFIKN